jgi:hypothetical protein
MNDETTAAAIPETAETSDAKTANIATAKELHGLGYSLEHCAAWLYATAKEGFESLEDAIRAITD